MTMTIPDETAHPVERRLAESDQALPGKPAVERLLAEIDQVLAAPVPAAVPNADVPDELPESSREAVAELLESMPESSGQDDEDDHDLDGGEVMDGELMPLDLDGAALAKLGRTPRVQQTLREVAEARLLVRLQADPTPLAIDTPKVRKARRATHEAARLHELAQDPVALAYRDKRVRRAITGMVMAAAIIALTVSSIGVQASVAKALRLAEYSFGWWAAFGVEPALSLPLLATVAVQAYSAIRGQVVDRKSDVGRKLFKTELLLLGLTLLLNCWPALVAPDFSVLSLIVHSLGPIAAVTAVWVLPALWAVLALLPMPAITPTAGPTARKYSGNAWPTVEASPRKIDVHRARLQALIADGTLPAKPSASAIQKQLKCATDTAMALRDELAGVRA
ncbi:hypothetical protein [Nonomuraea typhae]|uniref:DUF2637 domain-containing protein n=1 Tax=Nonomuraea typhae TaxID=2603600 RepID=A0ABW7Z699_9ACTN